METWSATKKKHIDFVQNEQLSSRRKKIVSNRKKELEIFKKSRSEQIIVNDELAKRIFDLAQHLKVKSESQSGIRAALKDLWNQVDSLCGVNLSYFVDYAFHIRLSEQIFDLFESQTVTDLDSQIIVLKLICVLLKQLPDKINSQISDRFCIVLSHNFRSKSIEVLHLVCSKDD